MDDLSDRIESGFDLTDDAKDDLFMAFPVVLDTRYAFDGCGVAISERLALFCLHGTKKVGDAVVVKCLQGGVGLQRGTVVYIRYIENKVTLICDVLKSSSYLMLYLNDAGGCCRSGAKYRPEDI